MKISGGPSQCFFEKLYQTQQSPSSFNAVTRKHPVLIGEKDPEPNKHFRLMNEILNQLVDFGLLSRRQ